jgi:hypothetical protein
MHFSLYPYLPCTELTRGKLLIYLPAYSPDLNPIEEAFSKIKAWIRRRAGEYESAATVKDHGHSAMCFLETAIMCIDEEDATGWFTHSGYY